MDFYYPVVKETKNGVEVFPDFLVGRFKDLMIRAHSFYAIWDEARGLWSTDEYDVQRLVDDEMRIFAEKYVGANIKYLRNGSNRQWAAFQQYTNNLPDNYHQLDQRLTFADQEVKRSDYVSRRLPYSLEAGDVSAWDELVGTLYSVDEREKIEWAIGAIFAGDAKKIQKFMVFYGLPGSGKGTVLNIILKLFEGYTTTFDAKALGSTSGTFATEAFKNNPLVAIQHDGDLSKIEDNTRLNSIISHEDMPMNEKYKPGYTARVNAFLFMGTNQPVKISDAKSGIIRRLIDVHPTGVTIPRKHYDALMAKIDFELGAIAHHCQSVYLHLGKNAYSNYRPTEMMLQTDVFFNFIEASYDVFKKQDGATLKQAYILYKEFCNDTGIERPLPQYKFREELRNYFDDFKDRTVVNGEEVRSYYSGFNANKYKAPAKNVRTFSLVMQDTVSIFDEVYASQPAQYATEDGVPSKPWSKVSTKLSDISTVGMHYVKVPASHIVIDFDLRDENGDKSLERNLEAASAWPPTYAEISQSGAGVHLHYDYDGDASELRRDYSEGIEVKVFTGNASLRRRLSKCNNVQISKMINTLPIREKKPMLGPTSIKSEKSLRHQIERNLNKDIHMGTKPSVDFIKKILDDAYDSGLAYDVTDMRNSIIAFASKSSNQSLKAVKVVKEMKFKGAEMPQTDAFPGEMMPKRDDSDERLVLWDVEVYPNLFVVCWKYRGSHEVSRMINPTPKDIEPLFGMKLVGFNNRRYDNHILYAAYLGYDNARLFDLSQKLINNNSNALFGEAYNISYADIYDFSSVKGSLKKFMIDLGIHKIELDIPWEKPVPPELWDKVVEYCVNDVNGTEAVLDAREQDLIARRILAEISGLAVNETTARHTAKIIFEGDRDAKGSFVYTDLSKEFPGYKFDAGKSSYSSRYAPEGFGSENPGEGGYVYSEPGMYENVAVLDVASMHPTSIIKLNLFGEYTPNFKDLVDVRLAIKRGDYDFVRTRWNGKLAPYVKDKQQAKDLSYALKIVINTVYGLTSARFDNPFRDNRNKDNIVAKRGALFMLDLKHICQDRGMTVVHIKTDSIKIADATEADINFVMEFGKDYGYDFEHETTYDAFCLVNDAVYIAREGSGADKKFTAVGAQFQHPYVFKTLFTDKDVEFDDYCETKQVQKGVIYIDMNHVNHPKGPSPEDIKDMHFVGRIGRFVPISGHVGGVLYRVYEDRAYAVAGTKGYLWLDAELAQNMMRHGENVEIDMSFFEKLRNDAFEAIDHYGPFGTFVNG